MQSAGSRMSFYQSATSSLSVLIDVRKHFTVPETRVQFSESRKFTEQHPGRIGRGADAVQKG